MAIEEYVVGQPVGYRGRFYSDPEMTTLVDPTTVTLWIRDPAGADQSFSYPADIDRESEGVYLLVDAPDQEGDWKYRWETTTPEIVLQGQIYVYPRNAGT